MKQEISKGKYHQNYHVGLWQFYYPDGRLKMTIDFSEKYFSILEFRDSTNKATVVNGTGQCVLEVPVFGRQTIVTMIFKNGKRDGKWIFVNKQHPMQVLLAERYKKGRFIDSKFHGVLRDNYLEAPYIVGGFLIPPKYIPTEQMASSVDIDEIPVKDLTYCKRLVNFSSTASLSYLNSKFPVDAVLCIEKDQNNNYWLGTERHGLVRFDSVFTFFNRRNSPIKQNCVPNIAIDNNNVIWFSYGKSIGDYDVLTAGLGYVKDSDVKIYNTKNSGLTSNGINDIVVDKNNVKWIATDNCIVSFNNKTWTKHFDPDKPVKVTDTLQYNNKNQYIAHAKQISSETSLDTYTVNSHHNSINPQYEHTVTSFSTLKEYDAPAWYNKILVLNNNAFFVSSYNEGCSIRDGATWKNLAEDEELNYFTSLLDIYQLDAESQKLLVDFLISDRMVLRVDQIVRDKDAAWVLTGGKLVRIKNHRLMEIKLNDSRVKNDSNGLFKKDFYCIFKDTDNTIWAGISCGIIKVN